MSVAGIIIDLLLMGLLLAALWFGVRLNARLKALKAGQEGFAQAVAELDAAAIKAFDSLKALRADADESQDLLHGRILAARELVQKLEAQIERAERARDSLPAKEAAPRDLNDRFHSPAATEEVSDAGLQAIGDMLRALAKPEAAPPEPEPRKVRTRQPYPGEEDLFDTAQPDPDPKPLFRRYR